ncbi:MAG: flavin reductase family protein [Anaerolineae bacterium]|nr:flavin reductase family protein [Anaerolineae bacterium]
MAMKDAAQQGVHADRAGPVVLVATNDGRRDNVMTFRGPWSSTSRRAAMTTGPWNSSMPLSNPGNASWRFRRRPDRRVVGIGTCSGSETDKFEVRSGSSASKARQAAVGRDASPISNASRRHREATRYRRARAWPPTDGSRKDKRTFHAVGDSRFIVDGRTLNRSMMRLKLPAGVTRFVA